MKCDEFNETGDRKRQEARRLVPNIKRLSRFEAKLPRDPQRKRRNGAVIEACAVCVGWTGEVPKRAVPRRTNRVRLKRHVA